MALIKRYEDLKCWQEARKLVNSIYTLINQSSLSKEFALTDQLKRAAISVMTNIAEGFSRYHKKDFIRFLDYAQSSAQEVKSLLYIVSDIKAQKKSAIKQMQEQCEYCQALTLGLLKHVKKSINKDKNTASEPEIFYLAEKFINHPDNP